jgi:uncharacterized protein with GYD domain
MATYIVIANYTDQGIRTVKDTTKRAEGIKDTARKFGVTLKDIYWTLGAYDVVATFEAPDDISFTAFGLSMGAGGNVRTQTLRAFSKDEMNVILSKMV